MKVFFVCLFIFFVGWLGYCNKTTSEEIGKLKAKVSILEYQVNRSR